MAVTTTTTPTPGGMYGSRIVTRSSWVCVELTTRQLIVTMVPTCIISLGRVSKNNFPLFVTLKCFKS